MGKRNETLDVLKGFACLAVVILHCPFPTKLGSVLSIYTRFAVPLFFVISGYFCKFSFNKSDRNKLKKKMAHIQKIFASGIALYAFVGICINGGIVLNRITPTEIFELIFLNAIPKSIFPYGGHLWFLLALLYCYPIYYILNRVFRGSASLYGCAAVVIVIRYVFAILIENQFVPGKECYYTNVWLTGLPFFVMGACIRETKLLDPLIKSRLLNGAFLCGGGYQHPNRMELFWRSTCSFPGVGNDACSNDVICTGE